MLKAIRDLGEFALGLFFDSFELLGLLIVPKPAPAKNGQDHLRALQTSAFVLTILLALWAVSTKAGNISDTIGIAVASVLYFSFSSYIVYLLISVLPPVKPNGDRIDRRSEALTISIGFNLIVLFFVAIIRQIDVFINAFQPLGFTVLGQTIAFITLVIPSTVTAIIALSLTVLIARKRKLKVRYSAVCAYVSLNALLSLLYVYLLLNYFSK